ncbi:family 20 glycosylhydrolase [Victivallis sp. Marseille-Q1083]|uniref:family 20 glycosylhydrolase n=1 Tax=Victivallis sp. Marseille-Q1083 TaxID=2717288 RepID=UPI00158EB5BC|nr:family 20 glycosylhydrolase [Victivallis sp. Marseille-Q1083]
MILKTFAVFFLLWTLLPLPGNDDAIRFGILPRPRQLTVEAAAPVTFGPAFRLQLPPEAPYESWLRTELISSLGWHESDAPEACLIQIREADDAAPEQYTLQLDSSGITLTLGSPRAGFPAVGRLLSLLDTGCLQINPDRSLTGPALTLADRPDFAIRGMHLQLAFEHADGLAAELKHVKRYLDVMARTGFNLVVLDLGGRYPFTSLPSATQYTPWSREAIREIVAYARLRGITPVPGINTISHVERAPQVLIFKDQAGYNLGMDVTDPNFLPLYRQLLDELGELFEQPPYLVIGADECREALDMLAERSGKSPDRLFADTVNAVGDYLLSKQITPIFWHDMLFVLPGELQPDGTRLHAADLINEKFIVDFWNYDYHPFYEGLERLKDKPNLWVSPWLEIGATQKLLQQAYRQGVNAVLGTTWAWPTEIGAALFHTAALSWNRHARLDFDTTGVFLNLLLRRQDLTPPGHMTPLTASGGAPAGSGVDLPAGSFRHGGRQFDCTGPLTFSRPLPAYRPLRLDEVVSQLERNRNLEILLRNPRRAGEGIPVDKVNAPRGHLETILYTPEHGKSTGTNLYGDDWIVSGGRVVKRTHNEANAAIPADGCVVSAHYWQGADWRFFYLSDCFNPDSPFELVGALPATEPAEPIRVAIPPEADGVSFLLAAAFMRATGPGPLATVELHFADGRQEQLALDSLLFRQSTPAPPGNFELYMATDCFAPTAKRSRLVILEYDRQGGPMPQEIIFRPEPEALKQGLTLVGSTAWQR